MKLILNDCLLALKEMPDNSVDSVVTDSPYGLSFMGKAWDYDVPKVEVWSEVLRVLKPGGYLLSFAGSRTYHRMAVNIEDAGFEIRDMIEWVYGSGFPKSLNIGKAYDKKIGNEREDLGESKNNRDRSKHTYNSVGNVGSNARTTKGNSPYEGWGTALKPAHEPIVMARKPFIGTVVENVIAYGTGGINIDGCRVETEEDQRRPSRGGENGLIGTSTFKIHERKIEDQVQRDGRFPANLIHDGSDEVLEVFPQTKASKKRPPTGKALFATSGRAVEWNNNSVMDTTERGVEDNGGSAARFFYCAKSSKAERGIGNNHPCVKPIALMQYLVRLVTPPNGTVLDPFMGSGTTGIACKTLGFDFIGIEMSQEYMTIAQARIELIK